MGTDERLFSKNFILIGIASFLMFFAFYLLMPVIAMYVIEEFGASPSVAGFVVSAYVVTALIARPFSGYLVDRFDRRKFYLFSLSLFACLFFGYIIADSIVTIFITRILLGATFALVTTAANTLAIDIMPSKRRAEGIGYFGVATVLSMALGPMAGLYLMELFSYEGLFVFAMLSCMLGVLIAVFIKTKPRLKTVHAPLSLDRFFLKSGASIAMIIALMSFIHGALMVYVSLYVKESDIDVNSGNFFLFLAIGVIVSRLLSGKLLNRGLQNILLQIGLVTVILASIVFIFLPYPTIFLIASLFLGMGFGLITPSIQSMIIDLVPHNKRGTANSTYFIALDLGSGLGMLLGGIIAEHFSYKAIYIIGLALAILALLVYKLYSQKDYQKKYKIAKQDKGL